MSEPTNILGKWKSIPLEAKLAMFVAPVIVFVATTFIGKALNDPQSEHLEVVRLLPVNGSGKNSERSRIDLTLRNTGSKVSVLTRAEFQIRRAEAITSCRPSQVRLPPTGRYSILLPLPGRGSLVTSQVSQEVGPNQADRFTFSFGLPRNTPEDQYMYQLDISLYHDADPRPIQAGSVLLAVPFVSPELFKRRCGDVDMLASFLATDSLRSPELDGLGRAVGAT